MWLSHRVSKLIPEFHTLGNSARKRVFNFVSELDKFQSPMELVYSMLEEVLRFTLYKVSLSLIACDLPGTSAPKRDACSVGRQKTLHSYPWFGCRRLEMKVEMGWATPHRCKDYIFATQTGVRWPLLGSIGYPGSYFFSWRHISLAISAN